LIREQTATQQARKDAEAQTIDMLASLYHIPMEEKRVTLLYIPRTNRAYWDLLRPGHPRWITPFVAPALSGLALLDGLPDPEDIPDDHGYGYGVYNQFKDARHPLDQSSEALGRNAEAMGFKRILVLDRDAGGAPLLREWCRGGTQPLFDSPTKPLASVRGTSCGSAPQLARFFTPFRALVDCDGKSCF
jgi:hypothetical protein